ncbi:MAG TPA: D-alanyl-D-alanine endopeptidase [Casimicrobiaceae bacterium]|nr:D-alanyl-D-alanine endopeptidase [Casimicrobiaceae bacterium]
MNLARVVVLLSLLASPALAAAGGDSLDPAKLRLGSANALVYDPGTKQALYQKGADDVTAIASVTKLMTAMVVLDANLPLDEPLDVDLGDLDMIKGSSSRLSMGIELPRREMLRLALMASENRAASALARHYPGGTPAFVAAMNAKAASLGMTRSHFDDSTGLSPSNVSTARDLARMVEAAAAYPLIREFSITPSHVVEVQPTGRVLGFNNSNRLVQSSAWDIQLQKTGYIREAGRCVVMLVQIASKPVVIVLLDSVGKYTRLADATRVKHWLETGQPLPVAKATLAAAGKTRKPGRTSARPVSTATLESRR